ncbi:RNA methyltransferase [bacterium]|nr:RNA methyltransferase [bacterium]
MTAPVVILVRPQMGENIGAAARAMRNFGMKELVIVAPRDGWPNEKAYEMARNAEIVLDEARIVPTLAEALADCNMVIACTGREHAQLKPVADARETLQTISPLALAGNRIGILFGPERTGLEGKDLDLADRLLTIPTSPEHPSLNLAQAVALVLYEWRVSVASLPMPKHGFETHIPAGKEAMGNLLSRLDEALEQHGFFREANLKPTMIRNIHAQLMRGQWSDQEVRTFHGIISALTTPVETIQSIPRKRK